MLSESDKAWIVGTFGTMLAGFRVPLRNDRLEALDEFSLQLAECLKPLIDDVIDIQRRLAALEQGIHDAAEGIREREAREKAADPDSWWRGNPEDE